MRLCNACFFGILFFPLEVFFVTGLLHAVHNMTLSISIMSSTKKSLQTNETLCETPWVTPMVFRKLSSSCETIFFVYTNGNTASIVFLSTANRATINEQSHRKPKEISWMPQWSLGQNVCNGGSVAGSDRVSPSFLSSSPVGEVRFLCQKKTFG